LRSEKLRSKHLNCDNFSFGLGFSQTPLISGSFINDVCAIAFSQLVISESNLNNFKMMTKAFPPI